MSPAGPDAGPVLVIGYGNPLRSDDGVGQVVAACLADDRRLAGAVVRAEHQLTPDMALDASEASLVILVDAAGDAPAGDVAVRRLAAGSLADGQQQGGGRPPMTHHLDATALAGLTHELWGVWPTVVIVSIGAGSLDVGEHLTAEVEAAVPRVVEAVIAIVRDHAAARATVHAGA